MEGLLPFDFVEASLELRPSGLTGSVFLRFGSELNRSGLRSERVYFMCKVFLNCDDLLNF